MKRCLVVLLMFVMWSTTLGSPQPTTHAQLICGLVQITDNTLDDYEPTVDDEGQVAWYAEDNSGEESHSQVFFYDGEMITQLFDTTNGTSDVTTDDGWVAWSDWDGEIYLYDGNATTLIPHNNPYAGGLVLQDGFLMWVGEGSDAFQIFGYVDSEMWSLSSIFEDDSNSGFSYDSGQLAWEHSDGEDEEIFFYDGSDVIQLTDNDYDDTAPDLSNGQVVWVAQQPENYEIFFYDGSDVIQLTDNEINDTHPQIDQGLVVWSNWDYEVWSYRDHVYTQLAPNPMLGLEIANDESLVISDGQVAWETSDGDLGFYNGERSFNLSSDNGSDYAPQINNGSIVWQSYVDGDYEIFIATCH